jgi:Transglutaminase-like superfamily
MLSEESNMASEYCKFLLFLWAALGNSMLPAQAADWPQITPEEKAMTSVSQQPGAPAVILYRADITDDTKNFHSVYVRLKVLTETGRKYQDVIIPIGRKPFTISEIVGRTVLADGRIIPWEGQPVDKVVLREHGVRMPVKAFTLPSVEVGSILDYRYAVHFPEGSRNAPEWMVQNELFQKKVIFSFIPTKYQPKTDSLRGETGSYIRIGNHNLEQVNNEVTWTKHLPAGKEPEEHITPQEIYKWVSFEMGDVPPTTPEPDMPPEDAIRWRVNLFYRISAKPEAYWKDAGKVWDKNVEAFLDRKDGILQAVNQLVEANDNPETKVRKIYDFVSQLQSQSFVSATDSASNPSKGAADVLQRRSGTHDELNRLFVAMIRAAGLTATMMWVPDRGQAVFDMNFMSIDQLDAEVAIVSLGGQDVFLDPGTKFCPYGMLSWHYSGNRGLRQSGSNSQTLADTPAPTFKQALIQRVAKLQLSEKGAMQGQLAVGFSGQDAMVRRQQAFGMSAEERKKLLENEVSSWFPGGTQVTLTDTPEWDKTEGMLSGQFKLTGPLAAQSGSQWFVPVQVFQGNEKSRFPSAQRTGPIYFDYPSRQVDEVHISLPANIVLDNLPASRQARTPYALYASEQQREGTNGFVSTRDMAMNGVLFSAKDYKELKDFYDKVAEGDKLTAALKGSL